MVTRENSTSESNDPPLTTPSGAVGEPGPQYASRRRTAQRASERAAGLARPPIELRPVPERPSEIDGRGLTIRQQRILEYIRSTIAVHGYPPSVREIGEAVNLVSSSSVAYQLRQLESKGYLRKDPRRPRALDIRNAPDEYDPETGIHARPEPAYVPLVGHIAAGAPLTATENITDVYAMPRELVGEGTLFLLKVQGDSMVEIGICDGDFVAVRQQPDADNGDVVAAMLDGEATVKTLRRRGGHVWLLPHNPAYDPIPGDEATILGKVVTVMRKL
jgi:repressor LexA